MGNSTAKRIAEAIRQEIADGRHRPGMALPSVAALRKRFGAGDFAVRHALHTLRDEGLVSVTKHVGAVVSAKAAFRWKGHVALVHSSVSGSYYTMRFSIRLLRRLEADGWTTHPVFLEAQPDGWLNTELLMRHVADGLSFAIVSSEFRQIVEILDRAAVPYVVVNGYARDFPNARAVIRESASGCYADLIRALKERGLKTIHEFDFNRRMDRSFKGQLTTAGIRLRSTLCKWDNERENLLGEVRECGYRAVSDFLADSANRAHLPDVILFDDDYLAGGGIAAIMKAGLRIPGDIHVVTHSNKGNEAVLGFSLARIENDPVASADTVADYVLAQLDGRSVAVPRMKLRYVPGESL